MSEHILTTSQDGIYQIQFNRPEKKNALTQAMYRAIAEAITEAEGDDTIRVLFFTGREGCFTSGNDIGDFLQINLADGASPVSQFLVNLSQANKPIVAAVNGVAVGIGTTMLLHCDLVYAAAEARFRLPFVNLALVPEAGSTFLLPQMIGQRRAAELLMFGEFFGAEVAREAGLVNAIYPEETLVATALQKATQLTTLPPAALRATKSLLKRANKAAISEAMAEEGEQFQQCLRSPEAQEAMQAFMERRPADFSKFT